MTRTRTKSPRHEVLYRGRVFTLERDRTVLPGGHTVTMDAIRHRGSVVLLPQPRAGRVILIRQFRYVIQRWIWELPAGSLEPGERLDRAARRECEEETGLRPTRITRLASYYPTPGFCDERMVFYLCQGLVRPARPAEGDADEQIEPRTFTMKEAWALVQRRQIVDMKTVLGLAMLDGRVPVPKSR
jgi:ADP-ribose pyrophosphatase